MYSFISKRFLGSNVFSDHTRITLSIPLVMISTIIKMIAADIFKNELRKNTSSFNDKA